MTNLCDHPNPSGSFLLVESGTEGLRRPATKSSRWPAIEAGNANMRGAGCQCLIPYSWVRFADLLLVPSSLHGPRQWMCDGTDHLIIYASGTSPRATAVGVVCHGHASRL